MLTKCKIITANSAGFCFGVDRAVKMVYNNLNCHSEVMTFGPIIHNNSVVNDLKSRGVKVAGSVNDITENSTVIIRSHGVTQKIYDEISSRCSLVIDATCPFVSRIHKIVSEKSEAGYTILIAGDKLHPEVEGIRGHCKNNAYIFSNAEDLKILLNNIDISEKKVAIIAQTTYNIELWEECKSFIKERLPKAVIYDTICSATAVRQNEAAELAKKSDIMIIIGGAHSSNTVKLKTICDRYTKCYHIENAGELFSIDFSCAETIGISAGASTPAYIIKEVQSTMSEILKDQDEVFNFEEALEKSFKKIYTGDKVKGYITAVNNTEVIVDIGTKHTGYVPLSELSEDPSVRPADVCKAGDEIDLIVIKINDQEGIATLSKKRVDALAGFEKIVTAYKEDGTLSGVVVNVVKGGVLAASNGIKVFIPASQATMRRDEKLEGLLKKTVNFKILEVNEVKSRAVGSIKAVAKKEREG
ncbi:MAG: 4-hydroxy-3-methylbut-2-enyl diphosphate reductase, partial [Oscillospiraceae bacterium]